MKIQNTKNLSLSKDGVQKFFNVHVLVAMAFLGHTPNGWALVVDHIDNDPKNNNIENLRVITQRENTSRAKIGSSKYVGVSWHKNHKKWNSSIMVDGKPYLKSHSRASSALLEISF